MMQIDNSHTDETHPIVAGKTAPGRLLVSLVQGAALYFLYFAVQNKLWPATTPQVFLPLLLTMFFVPLLLVSSLGHLPPKRVAIWTTGAAIMCTALGYYHVWRSPGLWTTGMLPELQLIFFFTGVTLFISHVLIIAATKDHRRIAHYASYFDVAWKLAIQISFSVFFVGVLWAILWLGAMLFMLVNLSFLKDLLIKPWFFIPISACALSFAFHLTDVRPGIVHGIRSLLLVLMSWLLPIATVLLSGFLISLPFTGLTPLWATRHASALLLVAAGALIILINTAFQTGEAHTNVARIVRISARVASALLVPIVAIAIYALALRVNQYGWTVDRVIAAACMVVASCYAIGYAWATLSSPHWLSRIAPTNIVTAFVIIATILALLSPVADPARLSVASQMQRLKSGKVSVEQFDFNYLSRFGDRFGKQALHDLIASNHGANTALIHEKANAALRQDRTAKTPPTSKDLYVNIMVWPTGKSLPTSFLQQNWSNEKNKWDMPGCLHMNNEKCEAYLIDFNTDSVPEILLLDVRGTRAKIFKESAAHRWEAIGMLDYRVSSCVAFREALKSGTYHMMPPLANDLEVFGTRISIKPMEAEDPCKVLKK